MEEYSCDSVKDLHKYFSNILEKKLSVPCKANRVREYVDLYAKELGDSKLAVYTIYHSFVRRYPDIKIDKPYFEDIVTRAWHSYLVNETLFIDQGRQIINTKRMSKRRF